MNGEANSIIGSHGKRRAREARGGAHGHDDHVGVGSVLVVLCTRCEVAEAGRPRVDVIE